MIQFRFSQYRWKPRDRRPVGLLERYQVLRIDLCVTEDDKYRWIGELIDHRIILASGRLRRCLLHRMVSALYELSGEHQASIDVLDTVGIGRRVARSRVAKIASEINTAAESH